jgi:serine/threonine protein kinase
VTEAPGDLIGGQFRLEAEIGRGGFGVVWRARDERLGRDVAAKKLFAPASASAGSDEAAAEEVRRRTLREARSAARIDHPGAVRIFDVVRQDGAPWIIMELLDGRSLSALVEEAGPLSPAQAADIGARLARALAAAHRAGVVHRDVNPANVLVTSNRVVLTDFGIAVIEGDSSLTRSGVVMGSPAFTAPERARGEPAVPASDLWSLGATLYYAVEGHRPFTGTNANAVQYAILTSDPPPPERAGPLAPVLERLLDKDASARPSATELADALAEIVRAEAKRSGVRPMPSVPEPPAPTSPAPPAPPRREPRDPRRLLPVLAPLAVLVAALFIATLLRDGAPARPDTPPSSPAALPRQIGMLQAGSKVYALAFDRSQTLAAGGEDGVVRLWHSAGRVRGRELRGHEHAVFTAAFNGEHGDLATGAYDGKVIIWDTRAGKSRATVQAADTGVGTVTFSPDGRTLAVASADTVRFYDTVTRKLATIPTASESTFTVAFTPTGDYAIGGNATIRFATGKKAPGTLTRVTSVVSTLAFSPDNRTLAAGGYDGRVTLYDTGTRRRLRTLSGHDRSITALVFSPGESVTGQATRQILFTAGGDRVIVWDAATGVRVATLPHNGDPVNALALSHDGHTLATGSDSGRIRLWAVPNG